MSDKANCKNCIHFNEIERRCCLNDGGLIKKECYFTRNNKRPMGADIILENQKEIVKNLQSQCYQQEARWQKLKELLTQAIQEQLDCSHELVQHAIQVEQWVLDKMQELEKENE